jgi:hypothetical protein
LFLRAPVKRLNVPFHTCRRFEQIPRSESFHASTLMVVIDAPLYVTRQVSVYNSIREPVKGVNVPFYTSQRVEQTPQQTPWSERFHKSTMMVDIYAHSFAAYTMYFMVPQGRLKQVFTFLFIVISDLCFPLDQRGSTYRTCWSLSMRIRMLPNKKVFKAS